MGLKSSEIVIVLIGESPFSIDCVKAATSIATSPRHALADAKLLDAALGRVRGRREIGHIREKVARLANKKAHGG
jgi:hypothetical protein